MLLGLVTAISPLCQADVVELLNGDSLTGSITALDEQGATIDTPMSTAPLEINANAIKSVTFPGEAKKTTTHAERIVLINGDTLPCKVLAMDESLSLIHI